LRRTRGDGNCFFRAFAFAYLESLLSDKSDLTRFKLSVEQSKDSLLAMGYPSFTLEDFHDTFIDVVDSTIKPDATINTLLQTFRDQGLSDYVVCYLRIVTSGHLKANSDFYTAFIEGAKTVSEYCSIEVEPMYKEADHLQISGLTAALGVPIRVTYMDRGIGGQVNEHDFPEGTTPTIHLLYRPGHYDILYK
jgi:ubiquitin thioesterase protein OTUB1